jgi:SAM-dependent methyltransferase
VSRRASYPAELYLALHRGTPGDVAFYQRHCRSAASVLELGCGDGRLLRRLVRPGRKLYGIDNQRAFLALARQRRELQSSSVHLQLGDMVRFSSPFRFDRILLPFSGFFCLSAAKKRECLSTARRHLKSEGSLIMDVYNTEHLRNGEARKAEEPLIDDLDWVARVFVAESAYDVYERHLWYPSRQRLDVTYRYCPDVKGRALTRRGKTKLGKQDSLVADATEGTIRHWYLHREQLIALVEGYGFSVRVTSLQGPLANAEQWALIATRRN